ncbi:MAG: NAD(P)/FAD-dependent oxidoreductase, partial [Candidatus Aminicenantes bacterium]|nr:NAD(P)/FAD-dependent oxidoreductase [Candidatus Aminicenantes bacterium]
SSLPIAKHAWMEKSHHTVNEIIMKYDVIVIGAGIGGLSCAAKLTKQGKKVLLLEKDHHTGGTSYIFRRNGYAFPMGPLSFSYPQRVLTFLESIGIKKKIDFKRNHFQLVSPYFDIVYSRPFEEFKEDLKTTFRDEKKIDLFFIAFEEIIASIKDISSWHPEYFLGEHKKTVLKNMHNDLQNKMNRIKDYSRTPCNKMLESHFNSQVIKNLLGSQGTHLPVMSLLNLALMWSIMSFEGIWFPSCGIHGLTDLMKEAFLSSGGELRTGFPVEKILIADGRASAVVCMDNEVCEADWIVSNADYKRTFFELIAERALMKPFLKNLGKIPYTQSELCVYLGIDPLKVNLKAMRAHHLFFRRLYDPNKRPKHEDFDNREIEICLWSDNAPELVPPKMATLVLRVGFPYDHFSGFWTGEKRRKKDYRPYKEKLAWSLLRTVENILPGLSSAVEVMEIATPLTYQDWGQRHRGSLAGWTWSVKNEKALGGKILVETPIPNLLMVGIYAASELFLGGVPTAMHTGSLAADIILEKTR